MALLQPRHKLFVILLVAVAVVLVLVAPLAAPSSISIASFQPSPNPMFPLTENPSFEQGLNSWSITHGTNSTMQIVSGEAFSGSHSLYVNVPAQDTTSYLVYTNNQSLPVDLNSSTFFSFAMRYVGASQKSSSVPSLQIIIVVSYLDKWTIPVFILIGNYSLPQEYTLVNQTVLGIVLTKSATINSTWQQYILQLGSDRMVKLYSQFLKTYGMTVVNSTSNDYFVRGFLIHPANLICYLDDVGLYNSYPAMAKLVVNKYTMLPSDALISSIILNQMPVYYSYSYGVFRDTYLVPVYIPVAAGMTFDVKLQTKTGFTVNENFTVNSGPVVI